MNEPSIFNVYVGNYPSTFSANDLPHDGYLGDFPMRAKTGLGRVEHTGADQSCNHLQDPEVVTMMNDHG